MAKQKSKSAGVEALKQASQGLQCQSETDAPFEVFEWPGEQGKPDKSRILELVGQPANATVKVKAVDAFFADATKEEAWHDDEEKADVQRFKRLVRTIKETLADAKVFQIGKPESDVYIVGRADSGWAGLKAKAVET
jgi:hypothetical protein